MKRKLTKSIAKTGVSGLLAVTLTMLTGGMNHLKADDLADNLRLMPKKGSPKELPERCRLKPDGGPCKAIFEKYYFDAETGKCREFFYGGCEGTVPFETMDECKKECIDELSEKDEGTADETDTVESSGRSPLDYTGFVSDAMADAIAKQEFEKHRFKDFFIFDKPKGWGIDTGEGYFGLSPDEKKIYGITLTAPVQDMVPLKISIHYYGEGNLLDDTAEKYIKSHADPVWVDSPGSSSDIIVDEVEISGRKAFKFNGSTPVHIWDSPMKEPEPDNGIIYRKMRPGRTVRVPEQYVVFPAGNAYYALRYQALPKAAKLFQPIFDRIVHSLKPLK